MFLIQIHPSSIQVFPTLKHEQHLAASFWTLKILMRLSAMFQNCDLLTTSTVTTKTANIQIEWFALESQQLIHDTNYIIILVSKFNQAITSWNRREKGEENVFPLLWHLRIVRHCSLLGEGRWTVGPVSCIFSVLVSRERYRTHSQLLQSVENVAPGVVIWPCYLINSPQIN